MMNERYVFYVTKDEFQRVLKGLFVVVCPCLQGPESLLFIIYVIVSGRRGLAPGILFNMLRLEELKPWENSVWPGTSRTARKSIYGYVGDKRNTRKNEDPLWKERGDVMTWQRLRYSMAFLPSSPPGSAPATLPELQKAKAGTGRLKNHPL